MKKLISKNHDFILKYLFILLISCVLLKYYDIYRKYAYEARKASILAIVIIILLIELLCLIKKKEIFHKNEEDDLESIPHRNFFIGYILCNIGVILINFLPFSISMYFQIIILYGFVIISILIFHLPIRCIKIGFKIIDITIVIVLFLLATYLNLVFLHHNDMVLGFEFFSFYLKKFFSLKIIYLYIPYALFAFQEELVDRNFLIMALKKFKLSNTKINIIQSILFGLMHSFIYMVSGSFSIAILTSQILTGFMLGEIFFYTNSIICTTVMHALYNLVWSYMFSNF